MYRHPTYQHNAFIVHPRYHPRSLFPVCCRQCRPQFQNNGWTGYVPWNGDKSKLWQLEPNEKRLCRGVLPELQMWFMSAERLAYTYTRELAVQVLSTRNSRTAITITKPGSSAFCGRSPGPSGHLGLGGQEWCKLSIRALTQGNHQSRYFYQL